MSIKYREVFAKRDFATVLDNSYVDASRFYFKLYNNLAVERWVHGIDVDRAVAHITNVYSAVIDKVYTHEYYDHNRKRHIINNAVVLMNNERMLKFYDSGCGILVSDSDADFMHEMSALLLTFKERAKRRKNEVNLIVVNQGSLSLTELEIKRTKLNIATNYEDDFAPVDTTIRKRLNTKNDKGIVLLHGKPGTGKTTYLRYLIARLKKKVMFVPNNVAVNLTNPDFVSLLIENPNSVLVIEDAEQVLQDRSESGHSAVSNLLNISDGLLADCLNIQIICSFNTQLSNIDSALMRKGRLIARYEFGPLSIAKAQALSDSLGFATTITRPMTVSEVYNQNELTFERQKNKIGFSLVA
ncbi:MAG TPA: AAA family ATPase [Chitinophagales bacterium]|nr:AAA family ATPase [Chitinophagales bacterium]